MRFLPLVLASGAMLAAPATAQTADATGWTLVSVGGVAAEPGGRIAFSGDGAVFGTTGCNRFSGQAVASPGLVNFNRPLAVTRMACPDPQMAQEDKVLDALKGAVAVAYDPIADRMMLIPDTGGATLGFVRAEE